MVTYGWSDSGCHYIIMKKYGPDLQKMLDSSRYGRFSVKTTVQVGLQLIDRLESLHKLGFIHKDLKLENILIGTSDKSDLRSSEIIVVDFGLA